MKGGQLPQVRVRGEGRRVQRMDGSRRSGCGERRDRDTRRLLEVSMRAVGVVGGVVGTNNH